MGRSKIGVLLAAAAAYGIFKYSKLSKEQKDDLMAKGKDFLNKNLSGLGDTFNKAKATAGNAGTGY